MDGSIPIISAKSGLNSAHNLAVIADRYWQFERFETPFPVFLAGELIDEIILFREAPSDYERRYQEAGRYLAELDGIDPIGLELQDKATLTLLQRELRAIRDLYEVDAHLRPSLLPVGPDFNTVFYANSVSIECADDAALYVARLASFPAYLADLQASLRAGYEKGIRYPRAVLEAAAANTRRMTAAPVRQSSWFAPFLKGPAVGNSAVGQEAERALAMIGDQLIPALTEFADFVDGPLSKGARESITCVDSPKGREYYSALVRLYTTSDLSPEAIHKLGHNEVARIAEEIKATAAEAGFVGDVPAYRAFLTSSPDFIMPDANSLRERAEVICKRIDARIPAFFRRIPRITYGVDSIPQEMSETMPPAYAQPVPSGGASAGIFWINGIPQKCPTYLLPAMAVHEAWPGHLMHIGLMSELDHLPSFRRHGAVKYTVCVEGWALYCEQLGKELGVYQSPHDHYGRLEMEMWRACRLVVDTGIHWFDWPRDRAIDYMAERLTLSRETIAAEVDRYAALPAQALAYQLGGIRFKELREHAEQLLGPRFSIRAYHEAIMTAGGVTLPVLEMLVDGWIAEVNGNAH